MVEAWLSNMTTSWPGGKEMPVRVIVSWHPEEQFKVTEGVTKTLIVTPLAPAIGVLRVIAGWFRPRLPMIIGNVPVEPFATVLPVLSRIAALMLFSAPRAVEGFVMLPSVREMD